MLLKQDNDQGECILKNLFLYGSCVSRDSYDFLDRSEFKLLDYVSRQSVISAYSPADPSILARAEMTSKFQIRNAQGDFRGDLWERLRPVANEVDLILWDIIDERNGVVPTTDGGHITFSYDLHRGKVFAAMQSSGEPLIRMPFGTDEHFVAWCAAADRFLGDLQASNLSEKLRLVVAPWAVTTDAGGVPNHWSLGPTPEEANALYARYYDYLTLAKSVRYIDIPVTSAVTKHDHKWGPGAYHYIDSAYEIIVDYIRETIEAEDPAEARSIGSVG